MKGDEMKIETITERFDRLAEEFKRDTGYYAPGKDIPLAENICYTIEQEAERMKLWSIWNKAYWRGIEFTDPDPNDIE